MITGGYHFMSGGHFILQGPLRRFAPPPLTGEALVGGRSSLPNGVPAEAQRSTRKGYAASVAQQSC